MRLPFPERISLPLALVFATILCSVEQLQQTSRVFSIYVFLFILTATLAFNLAGGFTRSTGSYVFFYSFGVIVGVTWKAYVGEAADTNLLVPDLTMEVFLGGIAAMLVAVFISRKLTRKQPFLQDLIKPKDVQNATIGCMVTGLLIQVFVAITPNQSGTFLSALNQINRFLPLAIILGTVHQIRKTNGRSSISIFVLISGGVMFLWGAIFYSKEGMFLPILCWLVAAASLRYRLRIYQVAGGALLVFILFHYVVPYAQYGRDVEIQAEYPSVLDRATVAFSLVTHMDEVRQEYVEDRQAAYETGAAGYYDRPQGLFDRLEILAPDDALINATERDRPMGFTPIVLDFLNLIPHVLYPNKPLLTYGNLYAHQIGGILADDDYTTGISFSPSGEGYHLGKWFGVLFVAPVLWTMLFTIFDSLCGDVRRSPWGLLMIALYAHSAPEGMLGAVIYMMGYTMIGLVFAAYTSAYVMPIIGTLLFGPEKTGLGRRVGLRGAPPPLLPASVPPRG